MKVRLSLSLLVLALIAGWLAFRPKAGTDPKTPVTTEAQAPTRKPAEAVATQPAAPPIELPKAQSKRDEKVLSQLKVYIDRTKDMTAETISAEQERIKEALKEVQARETEVPKSQLVTDEQGEKWERLEFHDGQIRYRPVPQEEKVQ